MSQNFESLKPEYAELWRRMQVRPDQAQAVDRIARRLIELKPRYEKVAQATGVPWPVVAVLHNRESDADFGTHLHNGDPLSARTRHVPAGRPQHGSPPFGWEESAIDALTMAPHSLHLVKDWTIERASYEIEKYNGFGYRNQHPDVKSPYLWSFSSNYECGKYVADGRFDAGAVDKQCGAMPIVKRMMELDSSIRFAGTDGSTGSNGAAGATVPVVVDVDALTIGSIGEGVSALQTALAQLNYQVGEIDGEFGPITAAALRSFQSDHSLPVTGIADQATRTALDAAVAQGGAAPADTGRLQEVLQALIAALAARTRPEAAPATPGVTPAAPNPPILSPIDQSLGGQALAGKKTALAVVAYAGLVILQAAGVIGAVTPAGQIITVLITAFGALGGISKVDRIVQALGMIAAARAAKPQGV
jgi:lysozyme family protein/peptidoglycan hydrolase-like protein with peptidoglycan-binding domain